MNDLSILIKAKLDSSVKDIDNQIKELSKQITQKLSIKLQIDAKDLSIITTQVEEASKKIRNASRTAISQADQGEMYQQVKGQIAKLGQEMKKNNAQLLEWTAQTKAKTGEITGATIKYADSLGRVKTELYSVVKTYEKLKDENGKIITNKNGDPKEVLKSIDLINTSNKYSQNIGKQQAENFTKANIELRALNSLEKQKITLSEKDNELAKTLNVQISKHKLNYENILKSKISIDKSTSENALNEQQLVKLSNLRKKNEEEISRIIAKQKDASSRSVSTTTSGRSSLGDVVPLNSAVNYNASTNELQKYARAVAGARAEYTKVIPKVDSLGNKFKELHIRVQEGGGKWHNYIANIDEATGKLYQIDRGLSDVTNRQLNMWEKFKTAMAVYPIWINCSPLC